MRKSATIRMQLESVASKGCLPFVFVPLWDLRDTLLQGFLGASPHSPLADERLPGDAPAKPLVRRVLRLMSQCIEKGRKAIRGLRSSNRSSQDLEQAFSRIPQELIDDDGAGHPAIRLIVLGPPRALRTAIYDEVYRIGRETLINALRHSRASEIEVELEYAAKRLRVRICDNGCGIDAEVLRARAEGHWSLSAMRERAERIGARLRVLSRAGAGTEVELTVPNRIAFDSQGRHAQSRRGRLRGR